MNEYYHAFVPGFNWWYLVGPMMVIFAGWIGSKRYFLNDKMRLMPRFNERLFVLYAILAGLVFGALVVFESMSGIVQWCDNSLATNDSPVWSLMIAPCIVAGVTMVYGVIVYAVGFAFGNAKRNRLLAEKRAIRERQMRREQAQFEQRAKETVSSR